jgi:hypothetical protein
VREYPLITYVVFAGLMGWVVLSLTRRNFRRGTHRGKARDDISIWLIVSFVILVVVLAK